MGKVMWLNELTNYTIRQRKSVLLQGMSFTNYTENLKQT